MEGLYGNQTLGNAIPNVFRGISGIFIPKGISEVRRPLHSELAPPALVAFSYSMPYHQAYLPPLYNYCTVTFTRE